MDAILRSMGLDAYQRTALWQPAILTIAPLLVTILLWEAAAAKLLQLAASVTIAVPILAIIMQYGRRRGRQVQARMAARLGGMPSAVALRHRDQYFPSALTMRHHAAAKKHGFRMPTPEQEAADPGAADDVYRAIAAWAPDQMRDTKKFALLHVENRNYGFRRNLLGLKPLAIGLTALAIPLDGALTYLGRADQTHMIAGLILGALLLAWLLFLILAINEEFVEDVSWAYAARQLGALEQLPVKQSAKKQSQPA